MLLAAVAAAAVAGAAAAVPAAAAAAVAATCALQGPVLGCEKQRWLAQHSNFNSRLSRKCGRQV